MRRMPCRRSRVATMRRSFCPSASDLLVVLNLESVELEWDVLLPFPSSLSKHAISRIATGSQLVSINYF